MRIKVTTYGTKLDGRLGITGVLIGDYSIAEVDTLLGNLAVRDCHRVEVSNDGYRAVEDLTIPGNVSIHRMDENETGRGK